jgi:ribonuclease Z
VVQEVTVPVEVPELAFTGDTSSEFITAAGSEDALRARLLIMELTFLDDDVTVERAQVPLGQWALG